MRTIALLTEKGGAGKSTLAVNLAVCARYRNQAVVMIDLDPQACAASWRRRRAKADIGVVATRAQELPRLLNEAKNMGADLVVIDTAGRYDVTTAQVIDAADLVLIPCRPSLYDLEAGQRTAEHVKRSGGKRAAFVLNAVPSRGSRAIEARAALERLLPVSPIEIRNLVAFMDALNDGRGAEEMEPGGLAASEITALYDWVIDDQRRH